MIHYEYGIDIYIGWLSGGLAFITSFVLMLDLKCKQLCVSFISLHYTITNLYNISPQKQKKVTKKLTKAMQKTQVIFMLPICVIPLKNYAHDVAKRCLLISLIFELKNVPRVLHASMPINGQKRPNINSFFICILLYHQLCLLC